MGPTSSRRAFLACAGGLAALATFSVTGCHRPKILLYEGSGVRFQHLSTWTLSKAMPLGGGGGLVSFVGPDHALIEMASFGQGTHVSLEAFAATVAEKRAAKLDSQFSVGGVSVGGERGTSSSPAEAKICGETTPGIQQRFTLSLLGVPVPHTAEFFMKVLGDRSVVFTTQAADSHLVQARAGWQIVFDSFALSQHETSRTG